MAHTICSNCSSTQGPFFSIRLFFDGYRACKNTKKEPNRITACVERRSKADAAKYKELLHVYDT